MKSTCPHLAWAASGAMALTGFPDGAPTLAPPGVMSGLETLGRTGIAGLLSGRAALAGFGRQGQASAGGASRLLRTRDGWCAISLARPSDAELTKAAFSDLPEDIDLWDGLRAIVADMPAAEVVARASLVGVPVAELPGQPSPRAVISRRPWSRRRIAPSRPVGIEGAFVVDLSSLWAGPQCAQILGDLGAHVVKVESSERIDGARRGVPAFYDTLHAGHLSVALDFGAATGRRDLRRLIQAADVVIEASRPRALEHLGAGPSDLRLKEGVTWLSITGHGRVNANRVAFGDDAAVAGGLVGWTGRGPVFCGDAIADPLTGVVAAEATVQSVSTGGGYLIDLSMKRVAEWFAHGAGAKPPTHGPHDVRRTGEHWMVSCEIGDQIVLGPRAPAQRGGSAEPGRDNSRVLDDLLP